jgi:hypothetical protein
MKNHGKYNKVIGSIVTYYTYNGTPRFKHSGVVVSKTNLGYVIRPFGNTANDLITRTFLEILC